MQIPFTRSGAGPRFCISSDLPGGPRATLWEARKERSPSREALGDMACRPQAGESQEAHRGINQTQPMWHGLNPNSGMLGHPFWDLRVPPVKWVLIRLEDSNHVKDFAQAIETSAIRQRLAIFFCKRPDRKYLGALRVALSPLEPFSSAVLSRKQHRQ